MSGTLHTFSLIDAFLMQDSASLSDLSNLLKSHPVYLHLQRTFQFNLNPSLLLKALAHRSFIHENKSLELDNYEKLEFLGDAVLGTTIASMLFQKFPELKEGTYSKFRGAIVNEDSLAKIAVFLKLDQLILVGRGELTNSRKIKKSIIADVLEAVIGALYLEKGFDGAFTHIEAIINNYEKFSGDKILTIKRLDLFDAKSTLQEKTMELYKSLPIYEATEIVENKQTSFEVNLVIDGKSVLTAKDVSKKNAQRWLAQEAIKNELYLNINQ